MEIMRVRILVYMCALMSCNMQTHTSVINDSGEQSALQEALLLVELLKSEYSRVLRENNVIKESNVNENDIETCAPTTASQSQTDMPFQHIEEYSSTQTLDTYITPGSRRTFHPKSNQKRRFNSNRNYYDGYGPANSWRRMDYENVFGPQPGNTLHPNKQSTKLSNDITVSSDSTTSTNSTETSTISSSTTSSSSTTPKLTSSTVQSTFFINDKHIAVDKKTSTIHRRVSEKTNYATKRLLLTLERTKMLSTNEPEQAQVAAELENELEGRVHISTSSSSSRRWSVSWRPSKRIHLARSTPYPIPLPENHAFCYTNPRSSLCRTFIK